MLRPINAIILFLCLAGFTQTTALAQDKPNEPLAPPAVRTVYLTFDDGPLEGSEDVDDAVRQEKIKINVFLVGSHALSSARMKGYCQLYEMNHWIEVGNHSYSHAHDGYQTYYANADTVLQDFLKNEKVMNLSNKLARLPGRNMWRLKDRKRGDVSSGSTSADKLFSSGFQVYGWDLEWSHDPQSGVPIQTVDDMFHLMERHFSENRTVTENHLVILCHDEMFRKSWEESELRQLINKLRAKDYRFGHLSEYP
jgi:peptidoglycan/xylan/chitin deacetylase (PgdA/CDA1 family)